MRVPKVHEVALLSSSLIMFSVLALAASPDFEAQTLDGQTVIGRIARLDTQELVLDAPDGQVRFKISALQQVVRKTAPPDERKAAVRVELMDGSMLSGGRYTVHENMAELVSPSGVLTSLPTRLVRSVRFSVGGDAKLTQQWSEIVETKAAGDLLVIRANGALDYLEGVQLDIDDETCRFELDKEVKPVKRAKVEGIVYFHPAPADVREPRGHVALADGGRVALASLELADETVKLSTVAGVALEIPIGQISRFDFSSGKIAYLSDLEPESVAQVPLLGFAEEPQAVREFYHFRRDLGFEHKPLRLDGRVYHKGLSLASRATLVYKLPGKFRWFKATVGIDDSVRATGDVHVEIKTDGNVLWQADVRGGEAARELELEIGTAKRLEILVDYGAGLDIGDRLDLCDARVTK